MPNLIEASQQRLGAEPKSAILAVPSLLKRMFWLLMSPKINVF